MSTWPESEARRDNGGAPGGLYEGDDPMAMRKSLADDGLVEETAFAASRPPLESSDAKAEHASIGELVGDISQGLSTLLRQEVALAKAEVRESATGAGKAAGLFGGAALAGWMTLLFLSLAVWEWLSSALESRGWAAVIVMAVWAIIAAILAAAGRRTTKNIQGLQRTTETAKRVPDALKGNEEAP